MISQLCANVVQQYFQECRGATMYREIIGTQMLLSDVFRYACAGICIHNSLMPDIVLKCPQVCQCSEAQTATNITKLAMYNDTRLDLPHEYGLLHDYLQTPDASNKSICHTSVMEENCVYDTCSYKPSQFNKEGGTTISLRTSVKLLGSQLACLWIFVLIS